MITFGFLDEPALYSSVWAGHRSYSASCLACTPQGPLCLLCRQEEGCLLASCWLPGGAGHQVLRHQLGAWPPHLRLAG